MAVPAGTAIGLGVLSSYLFALNVINLSVVEAQTVAVTVLVSVGLYLIIVLEASGRRRGAAVLLLCVVLYALYWLSLALPGTRDFFELAVPNAAIILSSIGGVALSILGLFFTGEKFIPGAAARLAE